MRQSNTTNYDREERADWRFYKTVLGWKTVAQTMGCDTVVMLETWSSCCCDCSGKCWKIAASISVRSFTAARYVRWEAALQSSNLRLKFLQIVFRKHLFLPAGRLCTMEALAVATCRALQCMRIISALLPELSATSFSLQPLILLSSPRGDT